MDDVRLIWSVRDAKAALTTLLQRGQIGDELWEKFLKAEKELEAEIVEVVGEANTFAAGYGQQIFGIASEMATHEKWKEVYDKIPAAREAESMSSLSLLLLPRLNLYARRSPTGSRTSLPRPSTLHPPHPLLPNSHLLKPRPRPPLPHPFSRPHHHPSRHTPLRPSFPRYYSRPGVPSTRFGTRNTRQDSGCVDVRGHDAVAV